MSFTLFHQNMKVFAGTKRRDFSVPFKKIAKEVSGYGSAIKVSGFTEITNVDANDEIYKYCEILHKDKDVRTITVWVGTVGSKNECISIGFSSDVKLIGVGRTVSLERLDAPGIYETKNDYFGNPQKKFEDFWEWAKVKHKINKRTVSTKYRGILYAHIQYLGNPITIGFVHNQLNDSGAASAFMLEIENRIDLISGPSNNGVIIGGDFNANAENLEKDFNYYGVNLKVYNCGVTTTKNIYDYWISNRFQNPTPGQFPETLLSGTYSDHKGIGLMFT